MQVGILLYNNAIIGTIRFEDLNSDYCSLATDGIERSHKYQLTSYLYYPRPDCNPSRSFYDDFEPVYDARIPMNVHRNHGAPLMPRVYRIFKGYDYTYYKLNDGCIAYTTNYRLKNIYYYYYGHDAWSHTDTQAVLEYIEAENLRRNPPSIFLTLDFWIDFPLYILWELWNNLYYIFFIVVLIAFVLGGLAYLVNEFEIVRRIR